jgi:hypothetical protein
VVLNENIAHLFSNLAGIFAGNRTAFVEAPKATAIGNDEPNFDSTIYAGGGDDANL